MFTSYFIPFAKLKFFHFQFLFKIFIAFRFLNLWIFRYDMNVERSEKNFYELDNTFHFISIFVLYLKVDFEIEIIKIFGTDVALILSPYFLTINEINIKTRTANFSTADCS